MKIFVPQKITNAIQETIRKTQPKEIKGAFYAKQNNDESFSIDGLFVSEYIGTNFFCKLLIDKRYRDFEKRYFKERNYEYKKYNYIGDWHSHPEFACIPSLYDINEANDDLKKSNANFVVQFIFKLEDGVLIGSAFLFNKKFSSEKINLIIEQ